MHGHLQSTAILFCQANWNCLPAETRQMPCCCTKIKTAESSPQQNSSCHCCGVRDVLEQPLIPTSNQQLGGLVVSTWYEPLSKVAEPAVVGVQGVLGHTLSPVRQLFERIPSASAAGDAEIRFQHFTKHAWLRMKESGSSGAPCSASHLFFALL